MISWSKTAINQFNLVINHIMADSIQNAEKVRTQILIKIGNLNEFPAIHPKDKYKINNDGSYRSFEV